MPIDLTSHNIDFETLDIYIKDESAIRLAWVLILHTWTTQRGVCYLPDTFYHSNLRGTITLAYSDKARRSYICSFLEYSWRLPMSSRPTVYIVFHNDIFDFSRLMWHIFAFFNFYYPLSFFPAFLTICNFPILIC